MASFRSEAEAFSGMSGMVEGHARRATGLKPRALARGVGSFSVNIFSFNSFPVIICQKNNYIVENSILEVSQE